MEYADGLKNVLIQKINKTEKRAVLHTALRNQSANEIFVDSKIAEQAIQSLDRMMNFKALHLS